MPEHEPPQFPACAVCGRTILRGERSAEYARPEGDVVTVCALCAGRADDAGWVPADSPEADTIAAPPRRRLFAGLTGRRAPEAPVEAPAPPTLPESPADLAIERFNASDARRIVAGLSRSLGKPRAAVTDRGAGAVVTVAWELSWYRWEVGLDGEETPVRVGKGSDISELGDEAIEWNAEVDEEGRIRWPDA